MLEIASRGPLFRRALGVALSVFLLAANASGEAETTRKYQLKGVFAEGCSCDAVCPCDIMGLEKGCEGVGVLQVREGKFAGASLNGTRIAYAVTPGSWVRLYIDAPTEAKRKTAEDFGRALFSAYGPIESVKDAEISLTRQESGSFDFSVATDQGVRIITLHTEAVLGANKKEPVRHTNIANPISSTLMQGRTLSGTFKDDNRSFTLANSNSFFNPKVSTNGGI